MKTLVARAGSDQPVIAELTTPQKLGAGDVRVVVAAAAFTYFDAFVPAHRDTLGLPGQVGLGFDFSGTVTEVAPDVSGYAVGDRVAGLHVDITAPVRAQTEELVIEASALAVVPDTLDLDVAAAVPLSALTARQALDLLGHEQGDLLVTGAAGAVGEWLIELATREGWHVTALVKPGTEDLVEAAAVITELGGSYDAVLDAAALHEPAVAAVRDGGRYVGFKPNQPQTPQRGITVNTVQVLPDGKGLAALLPLAAAGTVPVRIAGRAPLTDAATVYQRGSFESGSRALAPRAMTRIALVTGANQNLGRALVAGLAARMTPADRVLLTGRDPARVGMAARELSAQIPEGAVIEPRVLDVRDPHAIRSLADDVGQVDIVFSNAAARMRPDDDPADAVDVVADTNNTATNTMLREFAPRIRDGGRFIIVASALGTLDKLPASVRPRFAEAAAADLDAVDRLVDEWRQSVKTGRAVREGFGSWLNIPSKVAQVAAVRAMSRTRRSDDLQRGTLLMALCPGLIDTEASRPWFTDMSNAQTPQAAATWPIELALSEHFDPAYYGELVQFGTVLPWNQGLTVTSAVT